MKITEQVMKLLQPIVEANGYLLDEVLFEKEGNMQFLRIIIDKKGMIDIDDCVAVTKLINPILDEKDIISENYILDVCSKEKGNDENGQ